MIENFKQIRSIDSFRAIVKSIALNYESSARVAQCCRYIETFDGLINYCRKVEITIVKIFKHFDLIDDFEPSAKFGRRFQIILLFDFLRALRRLMKYLVRDFAEYSLTKTLVSPHG